MKKTIEVSWRDCIERESWLRHTIVLLPGQMGKFANIIIAHMYIIIIIKGKVERKRSQRGRRGWWGGEEEETTSTHGNN